MIVQVLRRQVGTAPLLHQIVAAVMAINSSRHSPSAEPLPSRESGTAAGLRTQRVRATFVRATSALLLLPGLLGSLLLSLSVVALFQVSWLRPLYDTPLPWVLALTVWLLPRAAVLQLWLDATRPSEAVHLAEMLRGREDNAKDKTRAASGLRPSSFNPHSSSLLWRLRDQPQFLAMSLLCYWAYCDLPTAYLLAPTGMASGLVRLYNFMHFGRSAALSAEACLFFVAPLVGTAGSLLAVRWWGASAPPNGFGAGRRQPAPKAPKMG